MIAQLTSAGKIVLIAGQHDFDDVMITRQTYCHDQTHRDVYVSSALQQWVVHGLVRKFLSKVTSTEVLIEENPVLVKLFRIKIDKTLITYPMFVAACRDTGIRVIEQPKPKKSLLFRLVKFFSFLDLGIFSFKLLTLMDPDWYYE